MAGSDVVTARRGGAGEWTEIGVPDDGTPDQWFLVRAPLRLGLGLRVGWHYTRADLYARLPVDAPDPVSGRAALDAFIADPTGAHLLPVANTWSTWPSPHDAVEYGRQPYQTLLMDLIVAHSNWEPGPNTWLSSAMTRKMSPRPTTAV